MSKNKTKTIDHEFVICGLSAGKSPSEVTLRSAEWAVITQVDGHKTIAEVADILAMSYEEAINLFNGLHHKGLLDIKSSKRTDAVIVAPGFFTKMGDQLTRIIGPVAPFVVDDAFWEMDLKKDNFPADRLPELIEKISDEIHDQAKKVKFQQLMLDQIKGISQN